LLPRRLQPRKQASLQNTQNTQWNDKTKHAFTPNFCIYAPKSFKFPNFQIAKAKQRPHDANSLLIYHHQIHPNPMMQKKQKE